MLFSLSCFPLQRLLIDKCHKVFGLWRNTYITPLDGTIAAAMLPKNTQSENYRKTDSHPGLEGTWRTERLPTPVFLPGELHGQRNLVGYGPWCHKESDVTEQLTLSFTVTF